PVSVSVMTVPGIAQTRYLVVFEEVPGTDVAPVQTEPVEKEQLITERIKELEDELASTKRYLHSVIEEQEEAGEELKSAHEEVQSSNEELQSTNEELLTAKEELQSTNEELTTLNDEMQSRNMELQDVNNDLINLLSSVNIPIVMLGNDLRIRRFTPQAERILNLRPSDVGRPVSDFRLKINLPDLVALCQEVINTLVPREREVSDPEGRLYSVWVRPYRTADNRIDGVVLALLDVTERKHSAEARYRRLFETAKDGIVMADANTGEIVDSNPFVAELFGYPRSRLMGARFWESDLFRNSDLGESLRLEVQQHEFVQKNLDLPTVTGRPIPVEVVASLYLEGEKRVIQFNIRNISARKQLEEQMRRDEVEFRQADKLEAVGRLAGGVAHEFNNILTAILGYADLLRSYLARNERGLQMLGQIQSSADRASALTRQLLAFGRRQIVSQAMLDVNRVITDMRQMISVLLRNNIELSMQLKPAIGCVRADQTELEQLILNLVLNARDAMPNGGKVTLTTADVDADESFSEKHPTVAQGQYVSITVKDTGTGMDQETQARMFEPFFTTKPKGGGVGLGLPTVYSIVKRSGGYVWAYSELGLGTTFTVFLPRFQDAECGAEPAPTDVPEPLGTETVLLVEDEHAVRELGRRFLEIQGYRVLDAAGGPEALRISREHEGAIQLMVTDVVMPRMSGREVALQLARERPEMKVLYTSGHTEDAIVAHGVLERNVEFLQKPFTRQALVRRVRQILDDRQAEGNTNES
ncbi:MAG: PAS domain-containing protein, partial [Acidobacteriia bacterium]|nr:PAS domain-containing protein [Terriglobia bacterium]